MDAKPRTQRIKELDGLRAISVLLVLVYHSITWGNIAGPMSPLVTDALAYMGHTGVDIFFVISGFIITRLMLEEREARGSVSLLNFYIKRIFRILPVYFTYLFVIWLLGKMGIIDLAGSSFMIALLFFSNVIKEVNWFLGHTWTLSVEEQYYIVFPTIMWKVLKGNRYWFAWILAGAYGFAFCSLKITTMLQHKHPGTTINLSALYPFRYIIAGVLLALGWSSVSKAFGARGWLFPLICVGWMIVGGVFSVPLGYALVFEATEPFIIAGVMAWIICNPARCGFLRISPLQWLGKCSYSIYLWQQLFTAPAILYLGVKLSDPRISIVLILAVSALSYYLIERNCIALGRRLIERIEKKRASLSVGVAAPEIV